ncbi:NAD(P)H-dependent glycerol-3-phosphate dehydrogenase [Isoptericola sp. b441]|uniref:Glycerol-3-phosphate dehydrogenase [NAD(P)+] n=1 Tax=Actinotalea lenta TaxID=3064654 RepID=A0ABT9DBB2_9CELL|nr:MULTISPECIES: NAD(P)H-dependent glycerol-3-phosphate dehydrogenase [unclassified Isoptericola]MDO8108179.1 NAD(P)H-dependent glycerol-3-phosphate dehydrogenase [Isoptericola sp. b441]MDO8120150.1 NAD(P)H-dependent glycerol-3-phosphate dehydrogenase [Isoptericola sp. b490]
MRVAVLGAGAWGSTFASVLADAGNDVMVWGRDPAVVARIADQHRSPAVAELVVPDTVRATTDPALAMRGAELVAVAVPAQSAREILTPLAGLLEPGAVVLSLMKGIELSTGLRMSQVIVEALGVPASRVAVLSGPNLAREIAQHQPTATVIAAQDEELARRLTAVCATGWFRPYTNTDVIGVELCGAVKNVVAIGIGIAQGRGYGDNTTATLITRGLAEIARLGLALGADVETFAGLAGMGDLFATCDSPLSRNHQLGRRIGEGMDLEHALAATPGTAEGVKTARSVVELAQRIGVDMPISSAVSAVLHEGQPVDLMGELLLARPHKADGV